MDDDNRSADDNSLNNERTVGIVWDSPFLQVDDNDDQVPFIKITDEGEVMVYYRYRIQ